MAFTQPKASTSARGYGAAHARARKAALAVFTSGDPCCLCGKPMWDSRGLHLDHQPGTDTYRGLAHAACNRRDGARRGAQAVNRGRGFTPLRDWS